MSVELNSTRHDVIQLEELATKLREEMKVELKSLSDKITEASKLEKTKWRDLDQMETRVKGLVEEVDSVEKLEVR